MLWGGVGWVMMKYILKFIKSCQYRVQCHLNISFSTEKWCHYSQYLYDIVIVAFSAVGY